MPLLQHITAKYVSERHQMDLVDMKGEEVSANSREYRYIRTLQDVFSRFLWMRALEQRRSKSDAKELNRIYWEHSPPKILQCGNTMFNFLPIAVHFQLVCKFDKNFLHIGWSSQQTNTSWIQHRSFTRSETTKTQSICWPIHNFTPKNMRYRVRLCSTCHQHFDNDNPLVLKEFKDRYDHVNRQYVPGNEPKNMYFHWNAQLIQKFYYREVDSSNVLI